MQFSLIWTLVLMSNFLLFVNVLADCNDKKNPDDGEVTAWFKNLGCHIKKGAEDLQESAKPWADKIAAGAKEFGHSVVQRYDGIKHKLVDDEPSTPTIINNEPTEKISLAPISNH